MTKLIGRMTGAAELIVMLPGAEMAADEFSANGFLDGDDGIDRIAVETGVECYLDRVSVEQLHTGVMLPAAEQGAKRIHLLGISLGGLGALLYARAHPTRITGLTLLAPFIGSRGLIAQVERAGGIGHWRPAVIETDEQQVLAWLGQGQDLPEMALGYGTEDRFAAAHRLLARLLPPERVVTVPGGHDWPTWCRLWQEIRMRRGRI